MSRTIDKLLIIDIFGIKMSRTKLLICSFEHIKIGGLSDFILISRPNICIAK